jgi:NAD kinase
MASKRQQTMAKMQREQRVREKRAEKKLKKQAVIDARNALPAEDDAAVVAGGGGTAAEELDIAR